MAQPTPSLYALDPALPVLLRPDGTVQLGWSPHRAVLIQPPRGVTAVGLATLLRAMHSPVSISELQRHSNLSAGALDDLLAQRDKLNADIQRILDQSTEAWGIKVTKVEIKNVDLDETMIRAMAKQAEAERTRRAKIIHAEGESQAAQMLVQAAHSLSQEPAAMQLRYLQTLADISNEKSSTIVFPLPLDLITPLMKNRG